MKPNIIQLSLLYALCSMHFYTLADHITVQGEVSGEWNADTVLVTGDLTVPDGQNLLIQPGTVVIFQGSFAMNVEGSVTAMGEAGDRIIFRVADTAGFSVDSIPDGGWRGIRFDHNRNSNPASVFEHCNFSFGKMVSDDPLTGNGGAICVRAYNKVSIVHCLFEDNYAAYNGGAIALDSADIVIHHTVFTRNRCGMDIAPWGYGGAVSSDNSSPDLRWNVFTYNSSTGIGGALSVRYVDCPVYNNVFSGNFSALGGALGVLHIPEINHRISNNLFAGNTALYFGGGIATINASPVYINNTITDNSATYGGGFYCKDSISPAFYNTIIWGNMAAVGPQGYMFEIFSQADFYFCDVEGGPSLFGGSGGGEAFSGAFEDCIDTLPGFMDFAQYPYSLSSQSPCIDAGSVDTTGFMLPSTDLAGNPRVSHGIIDMGAYEFLFVGVKERPGNAAAVKAWPNPTAGKFKVQSSKFKEEIFKFKVEVEIVEMVDHSGRVWEVKATNFDTGVVEIDISHLPDGIYLVRFIDGQIRFSEKILKISR
jgi:predicted outer membrane repeat protein